MKKKLRSLSKNLMPKTPNRNSANRNAKTAYISVPEAELMYDLLIRVEKIFGKMRTLSGLQFDAEKALKWQKSFHRLVLKNAEFLEELANDIGQPELYDDSTYIAAVREIFLKESEN